MNIPRSTDMAWRKSNHSNGTSGNCVELASAGGLIGLRDSKHPEAGHQTHGRACVNALFTAIKRGRLG